MTGGRLIPIPLSWAPFFTGLPIDGCGTPLLDPPHVGTLPADKSHLGPFVDGIALACGTQHQTAATPLSALVSRWKQVLYSTPLLVGTAAAWEGPRGTPEARMNHFDSLVSGGPDSPPVGDAPSKCKEAGGARDSITHDGDDSAQHWQGASMIQACTPVQCRKMCQLCNGNVSQAASQWTEASATGVMTPAREEQRRQCDKGEYVCVTRKMTSLTSASGAAWDDDMTLSISSSIG